MLTHKLSKPADDWFLEKKMHDPLVYSDFEEGNEVVVCRDCRQVFLAICWDESGGGCPFCHTARTVRFSRRALQHKGSTTIRIKSRSSGNGGAGSAGVQRGRRGAAVRRRRGSPAAQTVQTRIERFANAFCARVQPVMSLLLWGVVPVCIVLQGKAVLLDKASTQQFSDAFARTQWAVVSLIEESTQSALDTLEEIDQSVTDALDEITWPTDRIVQSVSDGIQRAQDSVNRPLDEYLPG